MSSELKTTNIKHADSASNNLVLSDNGNVVLANSKSFIQMDVITTSGNWTKPTDCNLVIVYLVGAGGGGGGSRASNFGNGGGGGGGCGAIVTISNNSSTFSGIADGGTVSVTLNAGGGGGAVNVSGSTGGTSTFGAFLTVSGGYGGGRRDNGAPGGEGGRTMTLGTGANAPDSSIKIEGGVGESGNLGGHQFGSAGGNSFLGSGAKGNSYSGATGSNATGYGGGGASGANSSSVGTGYAGGDGAKGVCIIWSYR